MTLEETLDLVLSLNKDYPKKNGDVVGVYMETKMWNFYNSTFGLDIAEKTFEVLKSYGLETVEKASAKMPIIIESFEKEALISFGKLSDLPLVYLMFYMNPFMDYSNLTDIGTWAHGVGPLSNWLFHDGRSNNETSKFIDDCHD